MDYAIEVKQMSLNIECFLKLEIFNSFMELDCCL